MARKDKPIAELRILFYSDRLPEAILDEGWPKITEGRLNKGLAAYYRAKRLRKIEARKEVKKRDKQQLEQTNAG